MDVYLMQHGVAATEEVDPARPLTDAGRMAVEEVAARARSLGVRAGVCVHSGKLRARQTAAILAAALGAALEERPDLGPSDPVGPARSGSSRRRRRRVARSPSSGTSPSSIGSPRCSWWATRPHR